MSNIEKYVYRIREGSAICIPSNYPRIIFAEYGYLWTNKSKEKIQNPIYLCGRPKVFDVEY